MNTNTNEVISWLENDMPIPNGFSAIPKHLQEEAKNELNGESSTMIPFESKSPLAKWAAKVRKNQSKGKAKSLTINNNLNK